MQKARGVEAKSEFSGPLITQAEKPREQAPGIHLPNSPNRGLETTAEPAQSHSSNPDTVRFVANIILHPNRVKVQEMSNLLLNRQSHLSRNSSSSNPSSAHALNSFPSSPNESPKTSANALRTEIWPKPSPNPRARLLDTERRSQPRKSPLIPNSYSTPQLSSPGLQVVPAPPAPFLVPNVYRGSGSALVGEGSRERMGAGHRTGSGSGSGLAVDGKASSGSGSGSVGKMSSGSGSGSVGHISSGSGSVSKVSGSGFSLGAPPYAPGREESQARRSSLPSAHSEKAMADMSRRSLFAMMESNKRHSGGELGSVSSINVHRSPSVLDGISGRRQTNEWSGAETRSSMLLASMRPTGSFGASSHVLPSSQPSANTLPTQPSWTAATPAEEEMNDSSQSVYDSGVRRVTDAELAILDGLRSGMMSPTFSDERLDAVPPLLPVPEKFLDTTAWKGQQMYMNSEAFDQLAVRLSEMDRWSCFSGDSLDVKDKEGGGDGSSDGISSNPASLSGSPRVSAMDPHVPAYSSSRSGSGEFVRNMAARERAAKAARAAATVVATREAEVSQTVEPPKKSPRWRRQIPFLVSLGYRVIVPDMLGYGQTDTPYAAPGDEKALSVYSLKSVGGHMMELLDHVKGKGSTCILIGHDWGGALVWSISRHYAPRIRAVASICTPYPNSPTKYIPLEDVARKRPVFRYQVYLAKPGSENELDRPDNVERFLRDLWQKAGGNYKSRMILDPKIESIEGIDIPPSSVMSQKEMDYYVEQYKISGFHGPTNWYRTSLINFKDDQTISKEVNQEALMIYGDYDPVLTPDLSKSMPKYIKRLTIKHVKASHWVQMEATEDLHAHLAEWLAYVKANEHKAKM
ncbi:hypothetical protein HK104_002818 [Borealophlyctis nickersoniae]|nr:hypothetical protein HK104_002818 [Borealophlyctis nickersoniae]